MKVRAVFSDIDGTFLNDQHQLTTDTRESIKKLQSKNIKFALVSARSPSGIFPILCKNSFKCPIISYSGALVMDEDCNIIYEKGMEISIASEIIEYIKENKFDLTWNLYSVDNWISQSKNDQRVREEEKIVEAESVEGDITSLPEGSSVHKILCMCNPEKIIEIERKIERKFPQCAVVKSSDKLLEIMIKGINKAEAVRRLCEFWNVSIENAIAFGDNYNDIEMLEAVGLGVVMGNAPEEIRRRFAEVTLDNNHDGIAAALKKFHVVE